MTRKENLIEIYKNFENIKKSELTLDQFMSLMVLMDHLSNCYNITDDEEVMIYGELMEN